MYVLYFIFLSTPKTLTTISENQDFQKLCISSIDQFKIKYLKKTSFTHILK